jgi:hypothetical protein
LNLKKKKGYGDKYLVWVNINILESI